jgi:AraC-like DNA-binding protein
MLSTTLFVGYRGLIQIDLNSGEQNIGLKVLIQKDFRDNALMPNPIDAGKSEFSLDSEVQEDIEASKHAISKKYSGSTLTGSQKKLLISKLEHLMQHEKLFINEKLSIEDVAIKLDTNSKYVSQIINETFNKNFYHFINSYRIDEAKRLLTSKGNEKYSILGIAQSVGFVSKSTFNVAFKRFTGLTPTEYIIQAETQSAGSTE